MAWPADTTMPPDPGAGDLLDSGQAGSAAIRGAALRVGGYGAGVLLSVVSAAVLFRHLGVERVGEYVTVLSLVTLAGGVTDAGLAAIAVREFSTRSRAERDGLLRSLIGARVVLTVAGVAGATAFAAIAGYSATLVAGTLVAGGGLLLQMVQGTYAVALLARLELGWVAAFDLLRQVVSVSLVVVLVAAGAGLLAFWAVSIPAGLAVLALTASRVRADVPLVPSFVPGAWRALMREILPYALATAVAAVYFRLAIIIVSLVDPGRQTGYFGASFRIVEVVIVVPQLVVGSAFPIFARAARHDRRRLGYALGRTLDACFVLGVGVAVVLALAAPFVISVVAGPEFAPAADVLRIQGAALAVSFVGAVFGYALLSLRRHRAVLVVSALGLAVSAIATTVLTRADGARGAAVATAAAELVLACASAFALRRSRVGVRVDWRAVPRVIAAALPALAIGLTGLPSAVQAALAAAIYAAAVVALRALPDEVLAEARHRLGRLARQPADRA